jgi:toxin ParE1/3/4
MPNISRSRLSEADLLGIAEHIALDSPSAAARWLDKIEKTISLLAEYPLIGEDVSHLRPGLRRFCQGKYLIFYEPQDAGIRLVRVLHGSRCMEDLFG